jgi:hypothetical protein
VARQPHALRLSDCRSNSKVGLSAANAFEQACSGKFLRWNCSSEFANEIRALKNSLDMAQKPKCR